MKFRKVVFDTSALIGAVLRVGSVPHAALLAAYRTTTIIASAEILKELEQVVFRPKFDRYLDRLTREAFLATFRDSVRLVDVDAAEIESGELPCRDPKDNKFLLAASVAKADVLISSDHDLLVLHPWNGIAILTPAEFLEQFQDR